MREKRRDRPGQLVRALGDRSERFEVIVADAAAALAAVRGFKG